MLLVSEGLINCYIDISSFLFFFFISNENLNLWKRKQGQKMGSLCFADAEH